MRTVDEMAGWDDLKWSADGLIPAILQDERTGAVLMFAWMNREALRLTVRTGEVHFWSRTRAALWRKGQTSGNIQRVVDVKADCDGDVLLLSVISAGPACHTGHASCFYRRFVPLEEGNAVS